MKLKIITYVMLFLTAQTAARAAVNVTLVTDEAEAVLAVLTKKKAGQTIVEADWQRVFQSEGYVRLKQRETSMQRPFEDAAFKTFVLSDELAAACSEIPLDAPENQIARDGDRCRKDDDEEHEDPDSAEDCPERIPEPDLGDQYGDQENEQKGHGGGSVDRNRNR